MTHGTPMRLILVLAWCVLPAVAAAAAQHKDSSTQFIDKSVVTYPTALGHYSLVKGSYDPTNVVNGVSLDYNLADAPRELQFNIYVYPLGRVDTAKAVADAMVEMEGEIRTLEQRKMYSEVKFSNAVAFDVAEPSSSILKSDDKGIATSADEPATMTSSAAEDPDARALIDALHLSEPPTRTIGRKRALTLTAGGIPRQSLAYVFYRNLFLISVRATETVDAQPTDLFNTLVDRVVQDLVPTMDIQNFGKCGTMYISVDKKSGDKDKDARGGAIELVREMGRIQRENCASAPGPNATTPAGHEQQTIAYPAEFWK